MTIHSPPDPFYAPGTYVRRVVAWGGAEPVEEWRGTVQWCRRLSDREVDCVVDIDHPKPGYFWGTTRHVRPAERAKGEG